MAPHIPRIKFISWASFRRFPRPSTVWTQLFLCSVVSEGMVLPTFCSLFPLPGLHLFPIQRRIAYFFVYWNPSYPPGLRSAITFLWSLSLCLYSKQSPIAFGSPQNVTHPVEKNHFLFSSYYNKGKDSVCFRTGAWQIWSSLVTQTVKNSPAMQETRVRSLVWEDPLEKGMATHPSILAWRIPWTVKPWGLQSMRSQRVGHDWTTKHTHTWQVGGAQ